MSKRSLEERDTQGISKTVVSIMDTYLAIFKMAQAMRPQDANLVVSPFCLHAAMDVVKCAVDGECKQEIEKFFPLNCTPAPEKFLLAKALWTKGTCKKDFMQEVDDKVAEIYNLPEDAEGINMWASKNTNGAIDHVIGGIDPKCIALLTSLLYFKDEWVEHFEYCKEERKFNGTKTKFMERTDSFYYVNDEAYERIWIAYQTEDLVLDIIMPKRALNSGDLIEFKHDIRDDENESTYIHLLMPATAIKSVELDMKEVLQDLGITKSFEKGRLTRMTDNLDAFIFAITQTNYTSFTRGGTVGASVTVVDFQEECDYEDEEKKDPIEVVLDMPFFYAIRRGDDIYYLGKFVDPKTAAPLPPDEDIKGEDSFDDE